MGVDISRFLGRLPVSIIAAVFVPGENPADDLFDGGGREEKHGTHADHHKEPEYLYNVEIWHEKCFA